KKMMYATCRCLFVFFVSILILMTHQCFTDVWKRVYLATYPRSGNHWMRFLIEEATHIATSSVYCDPDPPHLADPFPWGGYCVDNGYRGNCRYPQRTDIVFIKTHFPLFAAHRFDKKPSIKTLRLVRHPVDSIYSFYVYIHGGNPPQKIIPSEKVQAFM